MSLSINSVMIGGNLVRDITLKPVGTTNVAEFTLAVNKRFKGQDGQMKEKTAFIAVTSWGAQGETCAKYLRKGSQCVVEGELEQETWEEKDTKKKREKTKVRANHVHFVGAPSRSEPSQQFDTKPAPAANDDWA